MNTYIVWRFRQLSGVTSTQDLLRALARRGEPEGLVLSSLEQSSGRGRHGRAWVSPRGGLYMSVLLRPRRSSAMQLIPMIAALAVVAGIREETGVDSWIRWPNDIVIDRKKVAGTIAEVDYRGARFSHIVLGVGVNCNFLPEKLESFSPDSTTLLAVLGERVRIGQLRKRILDSLGPLYYAWDAEDDDTLLANRLAERLGTLGKRVTFETIEGKTMSGRAERLRSDGSLIVKGASGGFTLRGEQVARLREL